MTQLPHRIDLVRHGPVHAQPQRCWGWTDLELKRDAQLEQALGAYGASLPRQALLLSSDLRRAHETAKLIAAPQQLPITLSSDLREMNFGDWEGLSWDEIERLEPARYARYMEYWQVEPTPEGESFAQLIARLERWVSQRESWPEHAVIVAHHGSLRALLSILQGIDPVEAMSTRWDYGQLRTIFL